MKNKIVRKLLHFAFNIPNCLFYTGLWLPAPLTFAISEAIAYFNPRNALTQDEQLLLFAGTFAVPFYIWNLNRIAKSNGLEKFPLIPFFTATNPYYQVSYRMQALNKKPAEELLYNNPTGIVLGKYGKKYVCIEPGKKGASHTLVIGGSGSGKTSSVIADTILAAKRQGRGKNAELRRDEPVFICVDVKGELADKFFGRDNPKLAIFNPQDRGGWGFDFLYDINDSSSEAQVLETLRRVVNSLLPLNQNSNTDKFWTLAPRNIVLGLFLHGWIHKGLRTLPDLVDFVLAKNLKELINEVLAEVNEYSVISKLLVSFGGESADETMSGLAMNISNALALLSTQEDLRYLLRESDRKITPDFVDRGISIDLQIADAYLDVYAQILSLAIGTCCNFINKRKEGQNRQVVMIIDELGRIAKEGQIEALQTSLQIGRSRSLSILLCLQEWSAMKGAYSEAECADMLSNLPYRVILQSTPDSKDTVEMCVKAFGKFREKKKSVSVGRNQSDSYSFEDKDVLLPDDLLTLPDKNKVVLLSPYGAAMLEKGQYFNDKLLMKNVE